MNILYKAALFGAVWFCFRYLAGTIAPTGLEGPYITLSSSVLFIGVWLCYGIGLVQRFMLGLAGIGTGLSGLIGLWLEYLRWQPQPGQQGYALPFVLSNLDWLLALAALAAFALPTLTLLPTRFFVNVILKRNSTAYGTASWATQFEAAKTFANGDLIIGENYDSRKQPALGGSASLLNYDGGGHILTVAGSGAGKTVSVAIPNIISWQGNLIAHDPKGELHQMCGAYRRSLGRKTVILNPRAPQSDGINILEFLDPTDPNIVQRADSVAQWLQKSDKEQEGSSAYFTGEATKVIKTLILYVVCDPLLPDSKRTLRQVREYITNPDLNQLIKKISQQPKTLAFGAPRQYAGELFRIAEGNAGPQWQGILGNVSNATQWLSNPPLANLVCGDEKNGPTLSFVECLASNTDVFLSLPLEALNTTPEPMRLLIGALLNARYKIKASERTLFLIDEMPLLRYMQELENALNVGRGPGVTLWAIIQDIGQLEKHYQKHGKIGWFANTAVKTFFGINDQETAEMVSDMLGKETITVSSQSFSRQRDDAASWWASRSNSESQQQIGRPLMTPDELQTMAIDAAGNPDEQIVFLRNHKPVRCGLAKWYRRPEWRAVIDDIRT